MKTILTQLMSIYINNLLQFLQKFAKVRKKYSIKELLLGQVKLNYSQYHTKMI